MYLEGLCIWRDHVSGGTVCTEGPCIWSVLVVLVEASDVEPLVQRDHVSGGTTYLVGLCVQRDLVSGGEGPCMGACI